MAVLVLICILISTLRQSGAAGYRVIARESAEVGGILFRAGPCEGNRFHRSLKTGTPRMSEAPATNLSSRTRLRQHPERAAPEETDRILAAGTVAHVAWQVDGQPYAIPFGYHFDPAAPGLLYIHGGRLGATLNHLASGQPVCVTVTLVDGLVFSRTALYHSMNYRSVVCFGRGRAVEDVATKATVFEAMTRRYYPGREPGRDYQAPTAAHLEATQLIEIAIEEKSAKQRLGGPAGPTDQLTGAPETCGVVWFRESRETEFWPKG